MIVVLSRMDEGVALSGKLTADHRWREDGQEKLKSCHHQLDIVSQGLVPKGG
jgi:hypothetical protein